MEDGLTVPGNGWPAVGVWICSLTGSTDLRLELPLLCYTCQSVDTIGAKAKKSSECGRTMDKGLAPAGSHACCIIALHNGRHVQRLSRAKLVTAPMKLSG